MNHVAHTQVAPGWHYIAWRLWPWPDVPVSAAKPCCRRGVGDECVTQVVRLIEVLSVRKIRSSSLLEETGADLAAEVCLPRSSMLCSQTDPKCASCGPAHLMHPRPSACLPS